jgi:mRNA interferase YafQ
VLEPVLTKQFKKDYALSRKRQLNMDKLKEIMAFIVEQKPLPPRCLNHPLHGNYEGKFECHIQPDWLLIYRVDEAVNNVIFYRTGSHSDFF